MGFFTRELLIAVGVASLAAGCTNIAGLPGTDAALVPLVSSKAATVAEQVGGAQGFGGMMMNGYFDHAPMNMGFIDANDLADPNSGMTVRVQNDAGLPCTCFMRYVASFEGVNEQGREVEIPANGEIDVDIPCSEIVGMGPLETPGGVACRFADGEAIPNTMSVPGFLGLDYQCGEMHRFMLTPDVNDLDGDGDTAELIMLSRGMQTHMLDGGPMGHQHGDGGGMMGMHGGL